MAEDSSSGVTVDAVYMQNMARGINVVIATCKDCTHGTCTACSPLLDLPRHASEVDARQIIEGKLIELGKQPHNMQVIIEETPCTESTLEQ